MNLLGDAISGNPGEFFSPTSCGLRERHKGVYSISEEVISEVVVEVSSELECPLCLQMKGSLFLGHNAQLKVILIDPKKQLIDPSLTHPVCQECVGTLPKRSQEVCSLCSQSFRDCKMNLEAFDAFKTSSEVSLKTSASPYWWDTVRVCTYSFGYRHIMDQFCMCLGYRPEIPLEVM